ncbi:pyroglutamyl-peptidase I [Coprothermobacter platensis]|uniref:pyroglutamyl-peptidase I n=1 Tax=Coprothermobacter platensis TaxID=108819 RepID=UPI0003639646|nr:pyroglutamyl-peptidase I [Coprothermobacter platensis]
MANILLTGFEPFGGEKVNPAQLAVNRLQGEHIGNLDVVTGVLPVVTVKCIEEAVKLIEKYDPVAVINVGQAGGRVELSVEKVAINVKDYRIPDNEGNQIRYAPVVEDGPAAYFSSLPVEKIADALVERMIPASVSYTAGTYCCNEVFYGVSHYLRNNRPNVPNCFIHIPFILEQAAGAKPARPSMSLETIIRGLEIAIEQTSTFLS